MENPIGINSATEKLAVTSTSSSKTFPEGRFNNSSIIVYNRGPNQVFITASSGVVAAVAPTTTVGQLGVWVPANVYTSFTKSANHNTINAICEAGETATIDISFGSGV